MITHRCSACGREINVTGLWVYRRVAAPCWVNVGVLGEGKYCMGYLRPVNSYPRWQELLADAIVTVWLIPKIMSPKLTDEQEEYMRREGLH